MSIEEIEFIENSSITARGSRHRTTVPIKLFEKLKLKDKDIIQWIIFKDGRVSIRKKAEEKQNNATAT